MLGFVVRQLRYRRGRVATLAAGILVAAASFVLLTSAAQTSELQVKGTVAKNFRAAYDILVRPKNSFTQLEKQRGLIRENYLSGIFGGITMKQYHEIKKIRGIDVAAPIANIGYVLPFQTVSMRINRFLSKAPNQLYRLVPQWVANHGMSRYPDGTEYVYYTPQDRFVPPKTVFDVPTEQLPDGRHVHVCSGYGNSQESRPSSGSPFAYQALAGLQCYSSRGPLHVINRNDSGFLGPGGVGSTYTDAFVPIFIAAIDPRAEERLLNFEHTIVRGRPLRQSDDARFLPASRGSKLIPIVASNRTFLDEVLNVSVERLRWPAKTNLPLRLASKHGTDRWVAKLPGSTVGHLSYRPRAIYEGLIRNYSQGLHQVARNGNITYTGYFSSGSTHYQNESADRLRALPVRNPVDTYLSGYYGPGWAPLENKDTSYRRLTQHQNGAQEYTVDFRVVGRFDPSRLPGFSSLSKVPLETYYPPRLQPGNEATARATKGHDLLPTQNLAGYVAQPPLMLTTLKAARFFHSPNYFSPPGNGKAPISVIRVRVAGVTGADPLSRERIKGVAAAIHRKTGLAVDITAGSSPHPMLIDLPKGKFGQPPLTVKEGWVEKGVAVRFLDAVDKKSLFLFSLILLVCGLFLANAALASVRARRTEIGTLLTLGWSRASIFRAMVAELAVVGALAGIAGTVLALIAVPLLSLHISLLRTLLVAPVAVMVAIIAGLLPAWRAARGRPMDALSPPVIGGDHRRHVSHILGMALANTVRIPARTLVAITGLVFGVAALTVLIALNRALQGTLVGTLMGHFISSQIRGVDFLSVLLVIALGGLSVADILFLNLAERSAELVTLRTVGWRDQHLRALIGLEGIATGALGCVIGAALGIGVAALIRGIPLSTIALAAAAAAGAGLIVTVLAALLPLIRITALTPPTVLAEE